MDTQIRDAYRRAFLASDFDADWLTKLYTEIRDRLIQWMPKNGKMAADCKETMDPAFFRQMVEHNVFSTEDMNRLVLYVFSLCLKLGSPARDEETVQKRDKVIEAIRQDFVKAIPVFILEANETIDWIEEDIKALVQTTATTTTPVSS